MVEKVERKNVTVKIIVTSSIISPDPLTPSSQLRSSLSASLPISLTRYKSTSQIHRVTREISSNYHSSLLTSLQSINYSTASNQIILRLNISSVFCSITSTEDEWRATRAVIVSLSVILVLLLTLLSLTLICVWRREKRRKIQKISVGNSLGGSTTEGASESWKERTDRKISWKEERVDERVNTEGKKRYFGSFNLFPARKNKNSSQEVDDDDEDNCDRSQVRFVT